jgi:hypothetical protein
LRVPDYTNPKTALPTNHGMNLVTTIIVAIIFFFILRKHAAMITYRSFMLQLKILLTLVIVFIIATFLNWGDLKDYHGDYNAGMAFVDILKYASLASFVIILCTGTTRLLRK